MRQAGRYLPEFRSIREKNQDFIQLCLKSPPYITHFFTFALRLCPSICTHLNDK